MATVGEQLKAARESKRLSVEKIASQTFMRTDYVRAIEEGRYDIIGAPIYIKGFVKAYAQAVGIDPEPLIKQLAEELGWTKQSPTAVMTLGKATVDKSYSSNWSLQIPSEQITPVIIGILVGVAAFIGVRIWQVNKPADPIKDIPAFTYTPSEEWEGIRLNIKTNRD